jgi:hypothetical protein
MPVKFILVVLLYVALTIISCTKDGGHCDDWGDWGDWGWFIFGVQMFFIPLSLVWIFRN